MGTPPIQMANLGMADTLIIMVIALVVFGPRRLPQIGRQIGKLMYEFRKASNDFKFQMEEELRNAEEADRRKREEAERQRAAASPTPGPPSVAVFPAPPVEPAVLAAPVLPEIDAADAAATPSSSDSTSAESAPAVAPPEATALRIQPPSTGEPVAAQRPGSVKAETETPPAADPPEQQQPAADENSAAAQPAAHHG
jgi:sec-independent protein translocase protein TatB